MDGATAWQSVILPALSAVSAAALTILVGELTRWRRLRQDTRLAYLTSQIREFYGPIYSMLKARNAIFENWNGGGALQVVNDDIRKLFVQQNDAIGRLVLEKAHLIEVEGGTIPEVIGHLGAHAFIWNTCIQRFGEVPPDVKRAVREATWPEGFEKYIERTVLELKSELARSMGLSRPKRPRATDSARAPGPDAVPASIAPGAAGAHSAPAHLNVAGRGTFAGRSKTLRGILVALPTSARDFLDRWR